MITCAFEYIVSYEQITYGVLLHMNLHNLEKGSNQQK